MLHDRMHNFARVKTFGCSGSARTKTSVPWPYSDPDRKVSIYTAQLRERCDNLSTILHESKLLNARCTIPGCIDEGHFCFLFVLFVFFYSL